MEVLDLNIKVDVEGFDLDLAFSMDNEILALQGDSGSGKTTTLDCIAGIRRPDEGSIVLKGQTLYDDRKEIDEPIRDRNIGYVFQSYALFPNMTVEDNILFGVKGRKNEAEETMHHYTEILHIDHLLNKYPGDLSGGEQQRVAFLRALMVKPSLLLMDEPFSALDENLKQTLYEELLMFREEFGVPMIIITHNNEEAKMLADRIYHLKDGRIVSEDMKENGVWQ